MRTWVPLVAICLGSFLFLVDTTAVTVALPDIGRSLSASLNALQWVLNVYTLVLAVLMLTAGSVADRYGHRTVYLAGLGVFAAASLVCGVAPGIYVLIAARAVQGVGGAAMAVTTFALIGASYTGRDRGTAMGIWGAVNGLGAAAGPMLGGALTEYLGWRAIFFVNLPLAVITIALSVRAFTDSRRPARFDPRGMLVFAVCAGSLTYGLAARSPWLLAVFAGALVAFMVVERRPDPLLDLTLFRNASFSVTMACVAVSAGVFACLVYTSIWLQSTLGLGPVRAGLALVPLALSTFVTSTVAGRWLHALQPRIAIAAGMALGGAGCVLQGQLDARSTAGAILLGLVVTGVGVGLIVPAMGGAVLASVPAERAGMAVGAMTTFRQLGQTLGVALLGVVFQHGADPVDGLDDVYLTAGGLGLATAALALVAIKKRETVGPRV
jgi:EmrB/QacA subfamily drug resistance transporter